MSAATDVTAADRTRWQSWSIAALDQAYKMGAAAGLDPLAWQVGIHGLTGQAIDSNPMKREATLRAWTGLLGLPVREVALPGHMLLIATAERWGAGRCPIAVTADIYDEETE